MSTLYLDETDRDGPGPQAAVRALLNAIPIGAAVLAPSGVMTAVNAEWERITDGCDGGVRGPLGADLRDQLDNAPAGSALQEALAGITSVLDGACPSYDLKYACTDSGTTRWFTLSARPLDEPLRGVLLCQSDISATYLVQEQARQQRWFGSLVQRSTYLVSVIDERGIITYQSPPLLHLLGYRPEERIGQEWSHFIHPDDLAQMRPPLGPLIDAPGETIMLEFRIRHRDGSWRWFEATITNLTHDADVRGVVLNLRDISRRKAAITTLAERERTLRIALEAGRMAVWDWDKATNRITWSGLEHLAIPDGWAEGAFDADLSVALAAVHPDDRDHVLNIDELSRAGGWSLFDAEYRLMTRTGGARWLHDRGIGVERDASGEASRMVGVTVDVTERRAADEAIREGVESFTSLFHGSAEAMVIHDGDEIVMANQAFASVVGVDRDAIVGASLTGFVAPEWRDVAIEQFHKQSEVPHEILALRADGSTLPVEILERPIRYGGRWCWLMSGRDVTARHEAAARLQASEARFRALVQEASEIIIVFDAEGRLRYANPALERVLGYPASFFQDQFRVDIVHPDDVDAVHRAWESLLMTHGARVRLSYRVQHAGGAWVWLDLIATNHLEDPTIEGVVLNLSDVSEHKRLEAELRHLALHDALTGLPNRTLFTDRLDHAFHRARQVGDRVAVLFIDLDRFKLVNDGLGHAGGDALLRAVTRRISTALGSGDTLARFGGDEFVALLESIENETDAEADAARVLSALTAPITWAGQEIAVGASVGIAVAQPEHVNAEAVLREADAALYRAKASGRGRSALFVPGMSGDTPRRLALENDLRWAVARGELTLHYQPIVTLATGHVHEVEALLRWEHPAHGSISPAEFIPMAEHSGLIVPIGRWVLEAACRDLQQWGTDAPIVAINLSPVQFREAGLADEIARLLARTRLDPGQIRVELTEHAFVEDIELTREALETLRELGVRVAIDDFGTGYSSLGYLRDLPVDTIKLDRSFVRGLGINAGNLAIVEGMTSLAHVLGLSVTAEGIETPEQLAYLRAVGCDQGQGFLLGRPAPADPNGPARTVPMPAD